MEIGEGISSIVEAIVDKIDPKGTGIVRVTVHSICTGEKLKNARVTLRGADQWTDGSGTATFEKLAPGTTDVAVKVHFKNADYSKFIIQYPRLMRDSKAISKGSAQVEIKDGVSTSVEIKVEVIRPIQKIVAKRKHIDFGGADKYGHWWLEIDDTESYGWWPKYGLGATENRTSAPPTAPTEPPPTAGRMERIQFLFDRALFQVASKAYSIKESSVGQTFRGVDGELNGQTSFGGTPTSDPHQGDSGSEEYQPVSDDCRADAAVKGKIRAFASGYAGEWSWRFEGGNHCHTFQKLLLEDAGLDKFKVLK